MKSKYLVSFFILQLISLIAIVSGSVYADGEFIGSGGHGSSSCVNLCTSYGATWRWYPYDYKGTGVEYNANTDTTTIYGYKGNPDYAKTRTISGCKEQGGYWRYAMVAYKEGTLDGGQGRFSPGDQVGVTAIGGGGDWYFLSEAFGGGMLYIGNNWSKVESMYREAQRLNPKVFKAGWNSSSSLQAFCSGPNGYKVQDAFRGKSTVGDKTTGWQNANSKTADMYYIPCTNNGCKATFKHELQRTGGSKTIAYSVVRTSNLNNWNTKTTVKSGKFGNNNATAVSTKTRTLYPGDIVCETLTFKPNSKSGTKQISTKVCAIATGNAGDTSLKIQARNSRISKSWSDSVWAKPGDTIDFQTTYTPTPQRTYNLIPQRIQINNGNPIPNGSTVNTTKTIVKMFNDNKGSKLKNWNNGFSIQRSINDSGFKNPKLVGNKTYSVGIYKKQTYLSPANVSVAPGDVGKTIYERAITNLNSQTQTVPSSVVFANNTNRATIKTEQIQSLASVKIPYNFRNSTKVNTNQEDILYAGENVSVGYSITVGTRNNVTIGSEYATIVRNPQWKLEICYNGETDCDDFEATHGAPPSPDSRGSTITTPRPLAIRDIPAGTKVYVRSAVYPASSACGGNNGDLCMDARGSNTWAYSGWKEFTVAKRPSIQVWGGNIYSSGNIVTAIANKTNLAGYRGNQKNHTFGSWGELGIISNGSVKGFASGASLNIDVGSEETDFCKFFSPLTFPNDKCSIDTIAGFAGNSNSNPMAIDKNAVLSKFDFSNSENKPEDVSGDVGLNDENDETYKIGEKDNQNTYYYHNEGDISVSGGTAKKGTVQVIHAKNVAINGNLNYEDGYSNFEEMPKIVIYAENNININCEVNTIDALLIANGNVNTCSDSNDLNSKKNSNPLRINGAVIAGKLLANRTYGAATGTNSWIPAEIINFDPTLYLWGSISGSSSAGNQDNNYNLDVTYHEELAPRY